MQPSAVCPLTRHLARASPASHKNTQERAAGQWTENGVAAQAVAAEPERVVRAAGTYYLWERLYSTSPVSFTVDRIAGFFTGGRSPLSPVPQSPPSVTRDAASLRAPSDPKDQRQSEEEEDTKEGKEPSSCATAHGEAAARTPSRAALRLPRPPSHSNNLSGGHGANALHGTLANKEEDDNDDKSGLRSSLPPPLALGGGEDGGCARGLESRQPSWSRARRDGEEERVAPQSEAKATPPQGSTPSSAAPPPPLPAQQDSLAPLSPFSLTETPAAVSEAPEKTRVLHDHRNVREEQDTHTDQSTAASHDGNETSIEPPRSPAAPLGASEPLAEKDNEEDEEPRLHDADDVVEAAAGDLDDDRLPDLLPEDMRRVRRRSSSGVTMDTAAVTATTNTFLASATADSILWEAEREQDVLFDDPSGRPEPATAGTAGARSRPSLSVPSPVFMTAVAPPAQAFDAVRPARKRSRDCVPHCPDDAAAAKEVSLAGEVPTAPTAAAAVGTEKVDDKDDEVDRLVSINGSPNANVRPRLRRLENGSYGGGSPIASPSRARVHTASPPPRQQQQPVAFVKRNEQREGLCLTPSPTEPHRYRHSRRRQLSSSIGATIPDESVAVRDVALSPAPHARHETAEGLVLTPHPTLSFAGRNRNSSRRNSGGSNEGVNKDDNDDDKDEERETRSSHVAVPLEEEPLRDRRDDSIDSQRDDANGHHESDEEAGCATGRKSSPRARHLEQPAEEGREGDRDGDDVGFACAADTCLHKAAAATSFFDSEYFHAHSMVSPAPRTPTPACGFLEEEQEEQQQPTGVTYTAARESTSPLPHGPPPVHPSMATPFQAALAAAATASQAASETAAPEGGDSAAPPHVGPAEPVQDDDIATSGSPQLPLPGHAQEGWGEDDNMDAVCEEDTASTTTVDDVPSISPDPSHHCVHHSDEEDTSATAHRDVQVSEGGIEERGEAAEEGGMDRPRNTQHRRALVSRSLEGKSFLWAAEADAILSQQQQRCLPSPSPAPSSALRTTMRSSSFPLPASTAFGAGGVGVATTVSPPPRVCAPVNAARRPLSLPCESMFTLPRGVSLTPPPPQRLQPHSSRRRDRDGGGGGGGGLTTREAEGQQDRGDKLRGRSGPPSRGLASGPRVASRSPPPTAPTLSTAAKRVKHHSPTARQANKVGSLSTSAVPPARERETDEGEVEGHPLDGTVTRSVERENTHAEAPDARPESSICEGREAPETLKGRTAVDDDGHPPLTKRRKNSLPKSPSSARRVLAAASVNSVSTAPSSCKVRRLTGKAPLLGKARPKSAKEEAVAAARRKKLHARKAKHGSATGQGGGGGNEFELPKTFASRDPALSLSLPAEVAGGDGGGAGEGTAQRKASKARK